MCSSDLVSKDPTSDRWHLSIPSIFDEDEMIEAARDQLSAHNGNPMHMGRNVAVYETLTLLPKMVLRLTGRVTANA